MSTLNLNQYNWNRTMIAGHDGYSNPIHVGELVSALEGNQFSLEAAAATIRQQAKQIAELEAGLNHALARLNEKTAA
ncbi:hypothetical protein [Marinomonas ostreistagni]|uniref:Uncharacterized protein n=1 Tax=Marinomonas ostreistagni TaxID=359209 RepID=A0ABS0ZAW3_9GAMM|nr:hypothetical protein [Marinomonas ostreistagni]MBJ7550782.1 hypothetical protein [Marinomonas ostreistagni]